LFDANASVDDVVVDASLLVCCTRVIAASAGAQRSEGSSRRRAPTANFNAVWRSLRISCLSTDTSPS
jgi:hypothetical protein